MIISGNMILSIDQSYSGTGVCYLSSDGRMEHFLIKTKADMPWEKRMEHILSLLDSILNLSALKMANPSKIEHVILESYAFGGSFRGFQLGELGGVIKYFFYMKGFISKQIMIAHHKMFVARNGQAKKEEVISALKSRFDIDTSNDNIADAISMTLLYSTFLKYKQGVLPDGIYDRILMAKVDEYLNGTKKRGKRAAKKSTEPAAEPVREASAKRKRRSNKDK